MFNSFYEATVESVNDDWSIKVSSILFDGNYTIDCKPILYCSSNVQIQALPNKGDKVLLIFKCGDLRFPYYLPLAEYTKKHKEDLTDYFVKTDKAVFLLNKNKCSLVFSNKYGYLIDTKVRVGNLNNPMQPAVLGNTLNSNLLTCVTNISNTIDAIEQIITAQGVFNTAVAAALPPLTSALSAYTATATPALAAIVTLQNTLAQLDFNTHLTEFTENN